MIASTATVTTVAPSTISAVDTTQSPPNPAIAAAQRLHNRIFAIYVGLLVLTVVGTYLVWKTGNDAQDAIQADAAQRIAATTSTADTADALANRLVQDNLNLKTGLAVAEGRVASLQAEAANAKAAQQRVEIDLAAQQERTANAEKDLATLKNAVRPRVLTQAQQDALTKLLSTGLKGTVSVMEPLGDGEAAAFAGQIVAVLKAAGWKIEAVGQTVSTGSGPIGFGVVVRKAATAPPYVAHLQQAFFSIGIPLGGAEDPTVAEGNVNIIVGHKPPAQIN